MLACYNPATGQQICEISRGTAGDIDLAVAAARAALRGPWSKFTPADRQALLLRIAEAADQNFAELAGIEMQDMGAPAKRLGAMRQGMLNTLRYFAAQALQCNGEVIPSPYGDGTTTMILRAPLGVVGGIIPWNGPLISVWWILGGVLASGCTTVIKPAEDASLSVLRLAELLKAVGVPDGVFNVVTGLGREAGAALAEHLDVDRIAFTGSTETGRAIIRASAANMKRVQLELGGKSPDIIFDDADLERAIPAAAMGCFNNSGQICYAGTRLFVQRGVYDRVVSALADYANNIYVGAPDLPETVIGPIVSRQQQERVLDYIRIGEAEGARRVTSDPAPEGTDPAGYFVRPTVFADVTPQMRIAREEIFGPVLSVLPFETEAEVLQMANDTHYGLGAAVWTRDLGRANRMIRGIDAGQVWVNCYGLVDATVGFGGVKQSGYGWKGGPDFMENFLSRKAVTLNFT